MGGGGGVPCLLYALQELVRNIMEMTTKVYIRLRILGFIKLPGRCT